MAKITICTSQGEVWEILEDIKGEDLKGMAWASLVIEIKDILKRTIESEEK